jgi:pimeloyl-ACP methyl ester carboxylesterase
MLKKLKTKWWLVLVLIPLLLAAGFTAWASVIPDPMPAALQALESDSRVEVSQDRWLVFQPTVVQPEVGLILYPGGRVDPRAYAPPARAIAEGGYLVAIVPMPLNLAVLSPDRAVHVIDAHPEIERWAIGGHSLGGAMAARFVYQNPNQAAGLVLWASYPAEGNDLSRYDLQVVSIYASRDGLAEEGQVLASRELLPDSTRWVLIEGGNHAQFGWYGPQSGDNPAAVSREEQMSQVVQATLELLAQIAFYPP